MKASLCLFLAVAIVEIYCSPKQLNEKCERYKKEFQKAPPSSKGVQAQVGEFGHVASLLYQNDKKNVYNIKCGGVLISNRYIVTPAHCVVTDKPKFARLGAASAPAEISKPDSQLDYSIKNITVHPKFNRYTYDHDIAVLELETEVKFGDNVRPACLNADGKVINDVVLTELGEDDSSTKVNLYKLSLAPMDHEECNAIYLSKFKRGISDKQMCVKHARSDTCKADFQGPLQVPNGNVFTLVALPSYGPGCAYPFPTLYTKVDGYLDWIESIAFVN